MVECGILKKILSNPHIKYCFLFLRYNKIQYVQLKVTEILYFCNASKMYFKQNYINIYNGILYNK